MLNINATPTPEAKRVEEEVTAMFDRIHVVTDPDEQARRERERQFEREMAVIDVFNRAGCPARHEKAELDRAGAWADTEKKLLDRLGKGFLAALVGSRGNGKTQLGVELIRTNAGRLKRSRFCTAMQFFMEVKSAYNQKSQASESDIIGRFIKPSLLVIDELGKRLESDWENRLLYEVINQRYNSLRDTLIISNQEPKDLEASLGPSIVSRMIETGGVFECTWSTYRKPT